MAHWLNTTKDGVRAPSLSYATVLDACLALQVILACARSEGNRVCEAELEGFPMWTVRNIAGDIVATYWLSDADPGPAMQADH